jgi:hypothetical protein
MSVTSSYDWWLTPSVAIAIHIFQLEARIEKARWNGKALVFRVPLLFRALLIVVVPFFAYLMIRDWKGEDWFIRILGLAVLLFFLFSWPPTILATDKGIERRLWWKRRLFLPWDEIVDAEINASEDITVIGLHASIQFSRFHDDPTRFRHELLKRTKIRKFSSPQQVIGLHLE